MKPIWRRNACLEHLDHEEGHREAEGKMKADGWQSDDHQDENHRREPHQDAFGCSGRWHAHKVGEGSNRQDHGHREGKKSLRFSFVQTVNGCEEPVQCKEDAAADDHYKDYRPEMKSSILQRCLRAETLTYWK